MLLPCLRHEEREMCVEGLIRRDRSGFGEKVEVNNSSTFLNKPYIYLDSSILRGNGTHLTPQRPKLYFVHII